MRTCSALSHIAQFDAVLEHFAGEKQMPLAKEVRLRSAVVDHDKVNPGQ